MVKFYGMAFATSVPVFVIAVFIAPPRFCAPIMIARPIKARMSTYSAADAPDSSAKNDLIIFISILRGHLEPFAISAKISNDVNIDLALMFFQNSNVDGITIINPDNFN